MLTRSELLDAAVLAIRRTFGWEIRRRGATTLSSDVMVGVGGFVHYGVTMHDGSVLDADAFLMKSSKVPAGGRYSGNPAREIEIPHCHRRIVIALEPTLPGSACSAVCFESALVAALAYC